MCVLKLRVHQPDASPDYRWLVEASPAVSQAEVRNSIRGSTKGRTGELFDQGRNVRTPRKTKTEIPITMCVVFGVCLPKPRRRIVPNATPATMETPSHNHGPLDVTAGF